MLITIERVDQAAEERRGHMQLPSFPVHFRSSMVNGYARFIPATAEIQQCVGQSFHVEVDQDQVTDFQILKDTTQDGSMFALADPANFRVQGVVTSITQLSEPEDEQMISVRAKDAVFVLARAEVRNASLSSGDAVSFVVHGLSLWDEAI